MNCLQKKIAHSSKEIIMAQMKKPAPKKPMAPRTPSKGVKVPMGKTTTKAPAKMTPKPKVTKKPEKMTPQDAAMKKILEGKYGKIYG
jgi:hypothetical protein